MNKRLLIRIGIIISIMTIVSFSDWSFAAEETIRDTAYWLNYFIQIFSWIWVIFAKIAGEFLTNKRVYGEILWIDALLWKYWVVVKNIANVGLGVFFVYTILLALFKKEDILKDFKNILLRLLIAGIGIQTSRFFTAAILDVSTITLVSVGSFPAQVISKSPELSENFKRPMREYFTGNVVISGTELILFPQNVTANNSILQLVKVSMTTGMTQEDVFDELLPKYEDVSGPLYYLGIAILDTFSISEIPVADTGKPGWEKTIINTLINGGTTLVYSIEMMVLCIVAILRIFYLWMFIVLSPLVILFYCLENADKQGAGDFIKKNFEYLNKNLSLKSFLINAFKPAIIVLGISLSVVFMATMKGVIMNEHMIDTTGVALSSHCTAANNCDTNIDTELFAGVFKNLSKTLIDIILSIITVILVYNIIKISVTIGKSDDFVSKKIKTLQDNIGGLLTSLPVIPIPGRDEKGEPTTGHINVKTLFDLPAQKLIREEREFENKSSDQRSKVVESFFTDSKTLTIAQQSQISTAGKNLTKNRASQILKEKKNAIQAVRQERKNKEGGMILNPKSNNDFWRKEFTDWLNETAKASSPDYNGFGTSSRGIWQKMVEAWEKLDSRDESKRKLDDLFVDSTFVQAYVEFFLEPNDPRRKIKTRSELMNLDISTTENSGGVPGGTSGTGGAPGGGAGGTGGAPGGGAGGTGGAPGGGAGGTGGTSGGGTSGTGGI